MPLPAVVIGLGSILLSNIGRVIGIAVLRQAFLAGGLRGLAKALIVRLVTAAVAYFSIARITSLAFSAIEYLWRFNWNISDEEIDQQIKNNLNTLASVAGGAVGTTLGGVTCSVGMLWVNPSAMMFLDEIGEELSEEIIAAWGNLLRLGIRNTATALFLLGYKQLRNYLKKSGIAEQVFGAYWAEQWGKSKHVVSLAKAWEDRLDSIKPEILKNFIEELFEEAYEFCKEMSLLIARYADQALGLQRNGLRDKVLGDETIIEVYPNRDNKKEFTVLAGREEIVRAQAVQVLAQNQLLGNRDLGVMINAEPYVELARKRDPATITLFIEMAPQKEKPFFKPVSIDPDLAGDLNNLTKVPRPQFTIPYVERSKLDWATIKAAVGGINGYMYGRELCVLNCSKGNSNKTEIKSWGQTFAEAKDRCDALLALTDLELDYYTPQSEIEGGNRSKARGNMKPVCRVYPYRVTIFVGADTSNPRSGRRKLTSPTANFITRQAVVDLWREQPPHDWNDRISALFLLMN